MPPLFVRSLVVLLLGLALSSCREAPEGSPSPAGSSETVSEWQLTDRGAFRVSRRVAGGGEIPLNELFVLELRVLGADGEIADGIDVAVDADMPAHGHGMNTAAVVEDLGEGRYRVEGMQFHMPGDWVTWVDVTRDGVTERATFEDVIGRAR